MKLRFIIVVALLAALICVLAPWTVPVSPVPITLATFAVYLAGAVGGKKRSALAAAVYVLLGACGVPVFAGFSGGFQALVGPTGGFLIGYIPCAFITGVFADKYGEKKWGMPVGMVLGTVLLYALGVAMFMLQTKSDISKALLACAVPFLLGDALKIVVASVTGYLVRPKLKKFLGK